MDWLIDWFVHPSFHMALIVVPTLGVIVKAEPDVVDPHCEGSLGCAVFSSINGRGS